MISLFNPYTQEQIATRDYMSDQVLDKRLTESSEAFIHWRKTSIKKRIEPVVRLIQVIEDKKQALAKQMTSEMGKPITQAIAELTKCQSLCSYYAENAVAFLADEEVFSQSHKAFVRKQPLGVILGVMPWNFPFWQVFRFAIPTILAGNTVLIKHADNVQLSAEAIEECFEEAGFPKGIYTNICVTHKQVEELIKNTSVKAISLTGSTRAGRAVASISAAQLKPSLLELGGNNALIVLPDAPIAKVIKLCIKARFQNTGQSCIAGKRLLLHASIYEDFMQQLKEEVSQIKQGDPTQKETFISCLAREDLAVELKKQLDTSVKMGAKVTLGGNQKNAFFEPTIVEEVQPNMPVFSEETFGPLLAVISFSSIEEAIQLSNASAYGLGVSIFTAHPEQYLHLIDEFEEGGVVFNDFVKSDPSLPFGGVKDSGYGRELAKEGIVAFVNLQTIQLKNF